MIISRTPFRVSFFGGGTDYPVWFEEHGGAVLGTSIDKYCYLTCRYLPPFFDYKSRIVYSKVESVKSHADIQHPAVRVILDYLKIGEGVEIHHDGDLPARAGLGSSSSFTVGLLHALLALSEKMPTKMELAIEAIKVEQELLNENVGCQDQVITSHGGLCRIAFCQNGEIQVVPVVLARKRLEQFQNHLMLFFTGFSRTSSEIAKEQIRKTKDNKSELKALFQTVDEGISILKGSGPLDDFGKLLHESWNIKRGLTSKISSPYIDQIYDTARKAGAVGGKLLGAGGGGFLLIFAQPEFHLQIKKTLNNLLKIPFVFENGGSQLLLNQPDLPIEPDYPDEFSIRESSEKT